MKHRREANTRRKAPINSPKVNTNRDRPFFKKPMKADTRRDDIEVTQGLGESDFLAQEVYRVEEKTTLLHRQDHENE